MINNQLKDSLTDYLIIPANSLILQPKSIRLIIVFIVPFNKFITLPLLVS